MSGHRVNPDATGDFAVFLANALSVEFESFSLPAIFSPKPVLHHLLFNVSDVQSTVLLSILHELRSLVPSVGKRNFIIYSQTIFSGSAFSNVNNLRFFHRL